MDAGGEFHNYASDITRTFPVNGKFTKPQLDIYNATLRVNQTICNMARTAFNGTPMTIRKLHEVSVRMICQELVQLGIMAPDNLVRDFAWEKSNNGLTLCGLENLCPILPSFDWPFPWNGCS